MAAFFAHIRTQPFGAEALRRAATLLLFAAIGCEALVLATWLPETLRIWRDPVTYGAGDFPHFYDSARALSLTNAYNPGLSVVLHPLTYLSMPAAFRVYMAVNMAAMLGVGLIAQRAVASPAAKVAIVLGIVALPQGQWSLRTGHFTELLALATVGGFLLSERRPWLAGLCFAVLALKLQYLPVPMLYLLWTRNWRALGSSAGALIALSLAGLLAIGVAQGEFAGLYYVERLEAVARDVLFGQRDLLLPVQQSWQYSWRGFLISAGIEPNGVVVAMLLLLSFGVVAMTWVRCTPAVARAATAAGMVLLAPYATFYNWALLTAAAALLLHAHVRPKWLTPAILCGIAFAAAATQNATPFPSQDALAPAATRGLYWLQPAVLLAIAALAISGRANGAGGALAISGRAGGALAGAVPWRMRIGALLGTARRPATAVLTMGAAGALAAGFVAAAFVSHSGPFAPEAYFSRDAVIAALPSDVPVPAGARLTSAGAGSVYPYRIEWTTEGRTSDVAGLMRERLSDGAWRISGDRDDSGTLRLRAGRAGGEGGGAVAADIVVEPSGSGTLIRIEFAPLPLSVVRGYDEWLRDQGIIVKNVSPEDYEKIR